MSATRAEGAGARPRGRETLRALGARAAAGVRGRPQVVLAAAMVAGILWMVVHWAR
jgi:hypothetical protein